MSDEFYCSYDADSATLGIGGPLDADTVSSLERFAEEVGSVEVVDCTRVTLLAAAGVAALLRLGNPGSFTLLLSTPALRTLTICGLADDFRLGTTADGN